MRPQAETPPPRKSWWTWFRSLFVAKKREPTKEQTLGAQEARVLAEFCRQYGTPFRDLTLLKLALTHRSYLSVTGQGPRESNERLEFLGDSVLGLVTSEFLYRRHPDEHEGQLTKTKSLLVSKAILSRRALRMGLGRFVLMSHSEVESGGRQRLSILADAFESVIGAIYLDQGFEAGRAFIHKHLLAESDAITSDKRHTNYKSHLQEYVQNAFRTHPVYRIRSEYGPDHSKHFMVEVMVGKRTLGEGRGHNKKEAEQAAARDALEKVERVRRPTRDEDDTDHDLDDAPQEARGRTRERERERSPRSESAPPGRGRPPVMIPVAEPERPTHDDDDPDDDDDASAAGRRRRRSRRGGRGRHAGSRDADTAPAARAPASGAPEPDVGDDEDEFTRAVRHEARELTGDFDEDDDFESPRVEALPEPPPPARSAVSEELEDAPPSASRRRADATGPATERELDFGRGRRREAATAATAANPAPLPAPETAETLRVDPYGQDSPPAPSTPSVVDVTPAEPAVEAETDAERDARIDEMERALDNFGRRRSLDYGRRGRRR